MPDARIAALGQGGGMSGIRGVVLGLVAAVQLVLAGLPSATAAYEAGEALSAARVLHRWDDARARAYADGDAAGLRALYLPGSDAAEADVALLAAYDARGLRVTALTTQVLELSVLRRGPRVLVLRIVDRVAGGTVHGQGRCSRLATSAPTVRTVEWRRFGGRWRVGEVTELRSAAPGPRR